MARERPPSNRPPTFPVECFEIKLIAVIKLLETYRSGAAALVNHPSVQLAAPFVIGILVGGRLEKMSIHRDRRRAKRRYPRAGALSSAR